VDDEGGGQAAIAEAAREAAPPPGDPAAVEEIGVRRLSLQAAGGVAERRAGEEAKPNEEAGSADSDQTTTETDGEEGIPLHCF